MESRLLLDVVVLESTAILELLASEDETLLIWGDALLVLDLGLHSVDGVSQGLDENLHATTQTEHKMESRLLLDVVVLESTAILELLASEDETLLIWGDALL